jgi:CheY-like chemotaxis protein
MPKSILLADDSLTIQKVIELTFSDTDYELTTVGNGLEALESLERTRPDLVMADVVMPGKNGYEVCEAIRSNPAFSHIPVILLSGTFEPFDRERAEKARASAIITKPFDSKKLLSQVEALLQAAAPAATIAIPGGEVAATVALPASRAAEAPDASPVGSEPAPLSAISSASGFEMPSPGDITFEHSAELPDAAVAPHLEERATTQRVEPIEFEMEDSSPFGRMPAVPERPIEPTLEEFSPFPERDNVFEFPSSEPAFPSMGAPSPAERISRDIPPIDTVPKPAPASEPVFLAESPGEIFESTPPGTPAAARPAVPPSEIEELAQGASLSDLATMVSRVAPSASLSEQDLDRLAKMVVERLSERIIREIAWEVVPDMAEIVVRKRLKELEAESPGESG